MRAMRGLEKRKRPLETSRHDLVRRNQLEQRILVDGKWRMEEGANERMRVKLD